MRLNSDQCHHDEFEIRCKTCRSAWVSPEVAHEILPKVSAWAKGPSVEALVFAEEMDRQVSLHRLSTAKMYSSELHGALDHFEVAVSLLMKSMIIHNDVAAAAAWVAACARRLAQLVH